MKFPESVKILDVVYKIEFAKCASENMWGEINFAKRIIRIYKGERHLEAYWQTLWHEVLHAIVDKFKIDPLDSDGKVKREALKLDNIIDALATGINRVILDNDFMSYLQKQGLCKSTESKRKRLTRS